MGRLTDLSVHPALSGAQLPQITKPNSFPGEGNAAFLRVMFVERTLSACRNALISPALIETASKLREYDPAGKSQLKWLRGLWTQGCFPAEAQAAMTAAGGREAQKMFAAERVLLLHAALRSLDHLADARLDPSVEALLCSQYEFFADPGEDWIHRFDPKSYSYRAYAGMSLLERFPAGRMDWEVSGIPRGWLAKIPRRDIPRVLSAIVTQMGGFRPTAVLHMAYLQTPFVTFQERDVNAAVLRVALCLTRRPELKAIVADAWFYSPETHRVSPHLSWTTRLFEENGAILTNLGKSPEDAGYLVGSRDRQKLYESGDYKPTQAAIIWPRPAVLKWLSNRPEADSQALAVSSIAANRRF